MFASNAVSMDKGEESKLELGCEEPIPEEVCCKSLTLGHIHQLDHAEAGP